MIIFIHYISILLFHTINIILINLINFVINVFFFNNIITKQFEYFIMIKLILFIVKD